MSMHVGFGLRVALLANLLSLCSCQPEPGRPLRIAVSMSGGGYRASLHGLATLETLDRMQIIDRVEIVSGVSGGAITAAYYAYHRARYGHDFSFGRFRRHTLRALSRYEVPRTVLTTELVTGGYGASGAGLRCGFSRLPELFGGRPAWREVLEACTAQMEEAVADASVEAAVAAFAGTACDDACDGNSGTLTAQLTSGAVSMLVGPDSIRDVGRTFCALRDSLCRMYGFVPEKPALTHPFSELLHVALFRPWKDGQRVVAVEDLPARPVLIVSAAHAIDGSPWTATQPASSATPMDTTGGRGAAEVGSTALADAVAASACYPLFCRPVVLSGRASDQALMDGGVHDNLGVEAIRRAEADIDLLLVVDSQRPYTSGSFHASRFSTIFRVHDLLIDRATAQTLAEIPSWFDGRCGVVHTSFSADTEPSLSNLPTDLRPLRGHTAAMLEAAVRRIEADLLGNECVARIATTADRRGPKSVIPRVEPLAWRKD